MASILFASNNPTHWGTLAQVSTLNFDSARVPYSISIENPARNIDLFKPTTTDETWIHFRAFGSAGSSGSNAEDAIIVRDDQENILFVFGKRNNTSSGVSVFYNANGNDSGDVFGGDVNTTDAWDIKILTTAFELSFEFYQQGILVSSYSFGSNPANVTAVGSIEFTEGFFQNSASEFSEFIVADSDTRFARLNMVRPASSGAYSQWNGFIGTLADANVNTGITTTQAEQRTSVLMEDYTAGEVISNVVLSSQHLRGDNSPTKIRHFARFSTVDYDDASPFDVNSVPKISQTDYEINPGTSLPWEITDLQSVEFGFKSEA